ncbi:MAG: hypothetical protein ACOC33_02250 [bacterium]
MIFLDISFLDWLPRNYKEIIESLGVILFGLAWLINSIIKIIKDKSSKYKSHELIHLKNKIQHNIEIQDLLTECRVKFKANRVTINQFHNGTKFTDDSPILKTSITYESCDLSTKHIIKDYQNILISNYPDLMKILFTNKVFKIHDVELYSSSSTEYFIAIIKSHGIKTYYSMVIEDKYGNIIGYISLMYNYKKTEEIDFSILHSYTQKLSILLGK